MLTNGKEHMIIPQHNTHKHTLRNYVDTSKGEDTKGLHPSFHWNLCSTRSMGALEKPCIEVWAPPKVFFLIPPVSLRLIPLPSSNLCRRLILCRFSSWRIWMCSSMFTPGRGGTGTAENKKKVAGTGHRAPAHGAKGGGRMKQNRTDTHQWVMGRRDRKATTFISSYNRRMGGHNSMKRRAFKQKQQRMFVQQCQHMLFWLEQQNNLKYKGCFLHA